MQLSPIKKEHINNYLKLFTQLDVKQLMIFGRTVVAASDFKNCTMVNCERVAYLMYWQQKAYMSYIKG